MFVWGFGGVGGGGCSAPDERDLSAQLCPNFSKERKKERTFADRIQPTAEVTEKDFDLVMSVNVKSVFLGTQAVIPRLIEQGRGGSIVNIASVGVVRPRPGLVWYNASKGAVANVRLPLVPFVLPLHTSTNNKNPPPIPPTQTPNGNRQRKA